MWISQEQAVPRWNVTYDLSTPTREKQGAALGCFGGGEEEAVEAKRTFRASGKRRPYRLWVQLPRRPLGSIHSSWDRQRECPKTKAPKGWTVHPSQTLSGARQSEVVG